MKRLFLLAALACLTFASMFSAGCKNPTKTDRTVETDKKTLVVYYSLSGNTEGIAKQLAQQLGADIEKIETVTPYNSVYKVMEKDAQKEVEKNYQRPIKPLKHNVKNYDRIIIGTPTWWYKMASPVLTFMSSTDFTGKTVVCYTTNAGYPGSALNDMEELAAKKGAKVENGQSFQFKTDWDGSQHGMTTGQEVLQKWIDSLK